MIDLSTAVSEIGRIYQARTSGDRSAPSPYFFVVGAGISCPPIPLASELVSRFRQQIEQMGQEPPPSSGSVAEDYGILIDQAFQTAELRREFLNGLVDGHEPSAANLGLAHLLGPLSLSNLVVTTNFDGMLASALRLKGERPVVHDHPEALIQRFRVGRREIQVLEIHGTVQHYDFCNMQEEISYRSAKLRPILYSLLLDRSPLVVGYSGWEGDAFMTALRTRFVEARGAMRDNLFWFCYSQADADALPRWLTDDPSVRIVVPQGNGAGLMPATEVFDALRLELERRSSSRRIPSAVEAIAMAEAAASRGEPEEALRALRPLPAADLTSSQWIYYAAVLEQVYREYRDTHPAATLEACERWGAGWRQRLGDISSPQGHIAQQIAWATYGAGISLLHLKRYDEAIARFEEVLALGGSEGAWWSDRTAQARNGIAVALFRSGRIEEAFREWSELVRSAAESPEGQEAVAFALFNQGLACKRQGRLAEASLYWRDLSSRFGDAASPQVRELCGRALRNLESLHPTLDELFRSVEPSGTGALAAPQAEPCGIIYTPGVIQVGDWAAVADGLRDSRVEDGGQAGAGGGRAADESIYTSGSAGTGKDSDDPVFRRSLEVLDTATGHGDQPDGFGVAGEPWRHGGADDQPCEGTGAPGADDRAEGRRVLSFPRRSVRSKRDRRHGGDVSISRGLSAPAELARELQAA